MGHPRYDTGGLLLVSVQDREMYLSRGRGLEPYLTGNRIQVCLPSVTVRGWVGGVVPRGGRSDLLHQASSWRLIAVADL